MNQDKPFQYKQEKGKKKKKKEKASAMLILHHHARLRNKDEKSTYRGIIIKSKLRVIII